MAGRYVAVLRVDGAMLARLPLLERNIALPARMRRRAEELAPFLRELFERYHRPEYLGSDPLAKVHAMESPTDREVAALFSALLAYGNVKQIQRSLDGLFGVMGEVAGGPGAFVRGFDPSPESPHRVGLAGWKHRFTDGQDVAVLCYLLRQAMEREGSLEQAFARGVAGGDIDIAAAAGRFVDYLHSLPLGPCLGGAAALARTSFKHLLPRADKGSACKRIHLFLRWVARPADGIDLGLWPSVNPSRLLIPVDTHILRIARNLGLLEAGAVASLMSARAITASLRLVDAADPVRFDFAICRLGILKACPAASSLATCVACELKVGCAKRERLEAGVARRGRRVATAE